MIFVQTYYPEKLAPYIESFWRIEVPRKLDAPYVEEILPDGHHEIIFHLNSPLVRKRNESENWQRDPEVFFVGQSRKSYAIRLNPGSVIYAVRFHPHTQALFYDFPAALSTDALIPLHDVAAKDAIEGCIAESAAETFANLEKEFTKKAARLKQTGEAFLYVDAAVRRILHRKGNLTIESLEKFTGVSARHLEKSFQKFVGISPKQFCGIVKFNHFVNYRKRHPAKSLTECALETEFYDQPHLIRLSKLITGESPKAYFAKPNFINDSFPAS